MLCLSLKKSMHLKLYLSSYVSFVKQHLFIHSRHFINLKRQQISEFCFMSNYKYEKSRILGVYLRSISCIYDVHHILIKAPCLKKKNVGGESLEAETRWVRMA